MVISLQPYACSVAQDQRSANAQWRQAMSMHSCNWSVMESLLQQWQSTHVISWVFKEACLLLLQRQADLCEEQVHDLLFLRRLYIHRRGVLNLQRQALVSKPYPTSNTSHPQQELDRVSELTAGLKEIALQDCKAYHLVSHAMCRGVSPLCPCVNVCIWICSV